MLIVTTPAPDPWLITIEQARVAAGLENDDESRDTELEITRATVSAQIYDALNIAVGNGAEPTIRRETLTEMMVAPQSGPLVLSRRHNVEVTSVTGWIGVTDDYLIESEAGLIHQPYAFHHRRYCSPGMVTVVYDAGFDEVPPALISAALSMVTLSLQGSTTRDPTVKREIIDIDGVERTEQEFFEEDSSTSTNAAPIPASVLATIKRFRNSVYA